MRWRPIAAAASKSAASTSRPSRFHWWIWWKRSRSTRFATPLKSIFRGSGPQYPQKGAKPPKKIVLEWWYDGYEDRGLWGPERKYARFPVHRRRQSSRPRFGLL